VYESAIEQLRQDPIDARLELAGIGGIVTGTASFHEDRLARATLLAPLDHDTGRLADDAAHRQHPGRRYALTPHS